MICLRQAFGHLQPAAQSQYPFSKCEITIRKPEEQNKVRRAYEVRSKRGAGESQIATALSPTVISVAQLHVFPRQTRRSTPDHVWLTV